MLPVYHDLDQIFNKKIALSLPPHCPYDCAIDLLPGVLLPSTGLCNLSTPKRKSMEICVNKSLSTGLIRPSLSPFSTGFFLMGKRDGILHPCIDYRGLNDITLRNRYPLPLIYPSFMQLCHMRVLNKLDLCNTYHLFRIQEGDQGRRCLKPPLVTSTISEYDAFWPY